MDKPTFVYVTYIATTIEQLWEAITSESFTQQYWQDEQLQSDWQVGSSVQQTNADGELEETGEVLQSEPPYRLAYTLQPLDATAPSRIRFMLDQHGAKVKLTLIHDRLDTQSYMSMSHNWSVRLSTLKRLLELEMAIVFAA